MKRFNFLLLLVLVSLFNITCHKENWGLLDCKESNTIKLPQHAKDYFYFKVGSWWVYICSSNGKRDSIWVSDAGISNEKYKADKKDCDYGWGNCFEDMHVNFKSNISEALGKLGFIDYKATYAEMESGYRHVDFREVYRINDVYPGYKFDYLEKNNYKVESSLGAKLENIDSINVLGVTYKEVLKYHFPNKKNPPDWVYEVYYAKNIQLIRFRLRSDSSLWELEKYNIVK